MQVILLEKLPNLGQLGEVVKVKPGYARNYLIPQGKAKRATPENLAQFEVRRGELEKLQNQNLATAEERAAKLQGVSVSVAQKAGVDGRLFGSVTNYDISEALRPQGFDVPKGQVRLPNGPLKHIGEYEITLDLHTDVKAQIKVVVVAEQ